ncbi:MAG: protein kinase domain-containing protein, partial [Planctomycetota bacterium]|jgi:hypothetical protein
VYYAVSDGGREVAIKAVQNYEQIELRGIGQCMNIKSPHLVTIFDVKHNDQNEPFVIMEYVSGPSLRDLITESPGGLGAQKAAFFLREIAKGLSYLHECGIVHRDLKPGNVFYENGYVKIGDYGLAKAISASRHSGHTITVGTVHYMAPEIGAGSYNRSIDIYALGILLYEMLTGDVPFSGSSPAEILMRHMTDTPTLDNIEEPFKSVISKALAKDPEDRYKTVQEMVEDLYGSENIRNSVSHFSPDELSVIAERVAAKAHIGDQPAVRKPRTVRADEPTRDIGGKVADAHGNDMGKQLRQTAQRLADQADAFGRKVAAEVDAKVRLSAIDDPIDPNQRRTLALLTMGLIAVGAGILSGGNIFPTAVAVFVMTAICSKVILFTRQRWFTNLEPESQWIPRIGMCCVAALLASVAAGFLGMTGIGPLGFGRGGFPFGFRMQTPITSLLGGSLPWLSLAVPMLLVNWLRISDPARAKRISLGSAIWVGILGLIGGSVFGQAGFVAAAVLAGTSLVVQAYSPFGKVSQHAPGAKARSDKKEEAAKRTASLVGLPVSPKIRTCWWVGSFLTLGLGIFLLIMAGVELHGEEFAMGISGGVSSLILSLLCLLTSFRSRFTGWYRYLIKPLILAACVMTIVTSSVCMGVMNLRNDEFLVSLFLIIFPAVAFLAVAIIPARFFGSIPEAPAPSIDAKQPSGVSSNKRPRSFLRRAVGMSGFPPGVHLKPAAPSVEAKLPSGISSYKRLWALLLCAAGMSGFPAGLHRFYVGKIGTGILWFVTGGLFFIGQIIDIIMILAGQFKDRYEKPLEIWLDKSELDPKTPGAPVAAESAAPARDAAAQTAQSAEAVQPPAPDHAAAPSAQAVPTSSVMFERFNPLAFLFSGFGFVLSFVAVIVGLASALHLPHFVATGWPDPEVAINLESSLGANWPQTLMEMGRIISIVLMLPAAVCVSIGRRHLGARHLIRGILGLGGLLAAVLMLADGMYWSFRGRGATPGYAPGEEFGAVLQRVIEGCSCEESFFAAIIFMASIVILAWPARPRKMMLTPALNQGLI